MGMECYEKYASNITEPCVRECEGAYAFVRVDTTNNTLPLVKRIGKEDFNIFVEEYLQYKRSFEGNFSKFFETISTMSNWPFVNEQAVFVPRKRYDAFNAKWIVESVELEQRLEIVEIYFTAPNYDIVTKDARTDLVTKISLIGGMLGLFTGFSFVSGVEIIYFTSKLILKIYKK